ncbi:unnamed protein product [Anisakis simplex]|uniref:INTS5_C domain-containing protein n=1 Tax=Anisakis simplex TaxID=6269 RepID=A0A0M3J791_ANISI|nr:unnamed protein product [Anisakis simplex]
MQYRISLAAGVFSKQQIYKVKNGEWNVELSFQIYRSGKHLIECAVRMAIAASDCRNTSIFMALLASIMIRFENHPSQKSKPQEFDIDSLKRLFFVFIKGKVVPTEFAVFLQVIPNISHREAFLILLDLWRYLQSIVNVFKISAISEALESTQTTVNIPPIKGEVLPFMTAFRLVIQRNITQLAYLFPYLRKLGLSKNVE